MAIARTTAFPALAVALGLSLSSGALAAPPEKSVSKTFPLSATGEVSVKTYKGSITVRPGNGTQVEITARVEPDGDDSDMARKVADTEIRFASGDSYVEVESDYGKVKNGFRFFSWGNDGTLPFVHYTITMPRSAKLRIEDYKSRISVEGIAGALKLETYKGTGKLSGFEDRVDIETYKGDLEVTLARLSANLELETYKGRIAVTVPRKAGFRLEADTGRSGEVRGDFEFASRSSSRSSRRRDHDDHVSGEVNGGGPEIRFSTYKGELELKE